MFDKMRNLTEEEEKCYIEGLAEISESTGLHYADVAFKGVKGKAKYIGELPIRHMDDFVEEMEPIEFKGMELRGVMVNAKHIGKLPIKPISVEDVEDNTPIQIGKHLEFNEVSCGVEYIGPLPKKERLNIVEDTTIRPRKMTAVKTFLSPVIHRGKLSKRPRIY